MTQLFSDVCTSLVTLSSNSSVMLTEAQCVLLRTFQCLSSKIIMFAATSKRHLTSVKILHIIIGIY